MKQKLFLFFTIFSITGILHAQKQGNFKNDSVKQYIDKTLLLIHNNALNKDKIDWNSLQTEVYNKTKNAENIQAALCVYPYLFEKIEDHHGWLSYKNKNY